MASAFGFGLSSDKISIPQDRLGINKFYFINTV